jgi:hypothetical protein
MNPKAFALVIGSALTAIGVLSLIPSFSTVTPELPRLAVETSYGLFAGIFALNIVSKIAMIVIGLAGIAAANAPTTSLPKSISYARFLFAGMGVLAILGLIPSTNTLFGYWPLFGASGGAAGILSLLGAYFGFALTSKAHARAVKVPDYRENRRAS